MNIHSREVIGIEVDQNTRCTHYHKKEDVIAIKFKCCDTYYPCIKCHNELSTHEAVVWSKDEYYEKAILCGVCGTELTIKQYMACDSICPNCESNFNKGCKAHYHLYFEIE
ncbi:CHY zinc finger protein [Haloplasma contractile]|uniref:CHY zinc finger family protein n=1 Tax=Haloplasma contractile SSD-17B TaxID=1033810 RepID=F7PTM2_9MOLU|nr:CHY zinc finger protein [Haloplasma contractile]ERJ12186.1 CHY zinc finger family protein [Haloplasma contractile SSD-17B]